MKKFMLISLILAVALMAVPVFAGPGIKLSSTATVVSGNFGPGASYQKAWNFSQAGVDRSLTTTSFTLHIGPITIHNETLDLDGSTYAKTQGGTFGNGVGFQSGFGSAWLQ